MQSQESQDVGPDHAAGDYSAIQRAFLLRLDHLTILETDALNRGDVDDLTRYSQERARAVQTVAGCVPPAVPWAEEVGDLAAGVRERSALLRDALRDCMAEVHHELLQLAERSRLSQYDRTTDVRPGIARWHV